MRRAARIDRNQPEIVEVLRGAGASVQCLHSVGAGCPDLLVGYMGVNLCVEVKDGNKVPSARKLTEDQVVWHSNWEGQACVVKNVGEALELLRETATNEN